LSNAADKISGIPVIGSIAAIIAFVLTVIITIPLLLLGMLGIVCLAIARVIGKLATQVAHPVRAIFTKDKTETAIEVHAGLFPAGRELIEIIGGVDDAGVAKILPLGSAARELMVSLGLAVPSPAAQLTPLGREVVRLVAADEPIEYAVSEGQAQVLEAMRTDRAASTHDRVWWTFWRPRKR
jgi:hypothetical protein